MNSGYSWISWTFTWIFRGSEPQMDMKFKALAANTWGGRSTSIDVCGGMGAYPCSEWRPQFNNYTTSMWDPSMTKPSLPAFLPGVVAKSPHSLPAAVPLLLASMRICVAICVSFVSNAYCLWCSKQSESGESIFVSHTLVDATKLVNPCRLASPHPRQVLAHPRQSLIWFKLKIPDNKIQIQSQIPNFPFLR